MFLNMEMAEDLANEHLEQVARLQEMVDSVITRDGQPLPGVTKAQIDEALKAVREFKRIQRETLEDLDNYQEEVREPFDEEFEKTRQLFLEEEKSGTKFSSVIKKLFKF